MAMKARYTVVNGEVIAENRPGVRRFYVPDSGACTRALLDSSQSQTDTFQFWPYGESVSRSGTTPTPFQFGGSVGYYRDEPARNYVRARHFVPRVARWLTPEPQPSYADGSSYYAYVDNSPTTDTDPSGLIKLRICLPWWIADCKQGCAAMGFMYVGCHVTWLFYWCECAPPQGYRGPGGGKTKPKPKRLPRPTVTHKTKMCLVQCIPCVLDPLKWFICMWRCLINPNQDELPQGPDVPPLPGA